MTVAIDLFGRPGSGVNEGSVNSTDAAIFTEVPETPRVLADSHSYLAYTMKRSQTLRVVQRATLLKGSLRAHTKPIHAVRFVNYRSNVAASAAEGEFFVWVVTDDSVGVGRETGNAEGGARLSVKVYFKLKDPVTIPCFSFFINAENKRPDLLILYDTQAAILKSSALIAKYDREPLEATLRQNSTPLRTLQRAVSIHNNNNNNNTPALCAVGSGGWFAFTTEPTMVAACTLQNRNTPSWLCCGGDTVRALQLLDTPLEESSTVLVAATTQAVFQWTLTGVAEPTLLRRFVVGPDASIVAMESSRETFAVFDDKKRVAVVSVQPPENFLCTQYVMPAQVRRGGLCFNRAGGVSTVLVDISDRLTMFVLRGPEKKGDETATQHEQEKQEASQEQRKKTATILSTLTTAAATAAAKAKETSPIPTADVKTTTTTTASGNVGGRTIEARAGSRIIANLVNQLGLSPSQVHSGTSTNNNHNNNNNNNNTNAAAAGTSTTSPGPQRTSPYVHGSRPATAGLAATSGITPPTTSSLSKTGTTTTTTTTTTDGVKREDAAHKTSPGVANANVNTNANANATTVAAAAGNTSASTNTGSNATRPALHNASLPQAPTDGVLAAAVSQSEDEVRQALKRLESAMANTSQILQLVPDTIRRDHEQLLNLGLEAQMTELQQQMQKLPLQLQSQQQQQQQQQQSASGTNSAAFDTYALVMLMDALSRNIAKGVTRGVEESIATHLDHEVRQAMGNRVRNAQKQVLKNRLDEALKESTTQFVSQLEQTVQGVVRSELAEVLGSINGSLKVLENENSALQRELSLVMSSGVLEEMRRMREELRTLRETVMSRQTAANGSSSASASAGHATSSFQGRRPAPETILSTALSLMREQQQYHQALQYLLQCHQPSLVLQFLTTLSHEHESTYSDLIEDNAISNDVWCQVLLQLVEAAATSTEMQREVVVSVTVDIISEREGMLASTHGKKVATAMRDFAHKLRQTTTKVDFLQSIKDLEKLVQ